MNGNYYAVELEEAREILNSLRKAFEKPTRNMQQAGA